MSSPVEEASLDAVRKAMGSIESRVAGHADRVAKEACVYGHDTPYCDGEGLLVNLKTLCGVGRTFLAMDAARTGCRLYLRQRFSRVPKRGAAGRERAEEGRAEGVEGGGEAPPSSLGELIMAEAHDTVEAYSVVAVGEGGDVEAEVAYGPETRAELPLLVGDACDAVICHSSNQVMEDVAAWEEKPRVSAFTENLVDESQGKRVSPDKSSWRCEACGKGEGLWLNLSDGYMGCGRANWDGSGGCGSSLQHFNDTGRRFPIAVKLGTITPAGGDCFSYAEGEDDLVENPRLGEHLARFGINIMTMEKTEKSVAELNIDYNLTFEFDKITEAGKDLEPLAGPGFVGLENLGNTCYIASVAQMLFNGCPEFAARYGGPVEAVVHTCPTDRDLLNDFAVQMVRLGRGLVGKEYAYYLCAEDGGPLEPGAKTGVANKDGLRGRPYVAPVTPARIKAIVGRGHAEFCSARQQDCVEWYQRWLEIMAREERTCLGRLPGVGGATPSLSTVDSLFRFEVEGRIQCSESGKVRYNTHSELNLSLRVPLDKATNAAELEAQAKRPRVDGGDGGSGIKPRVPLQACLELFQSTHKVDDFFSTALGRRTTAHTSTRIKTFPKYLVIHLQRYFVGDDWTPKKLDCLVDMPEFLDLEHLRAKGMQPGEEELPPADSDDAADEAREGGGNEPTAAPQPLPDDAIVSQLIGMGFGENGCKRAALATGNSSAEAAMEWVFAHMEDSDFNDPLPQPASVAAEAASARGNKAHNPESVAMLEAMGFTARQSQAALSATEGELERAADWLFNHAGAGLEAAVDAALGESTPTGSPDESASEITSGEALGDGPAQYILVGIVSHMGPNTASGHYVCHLHNGPRGQWTIYNDRKVAISEDPPLNLGYMYMYRRLDA